MWELARIGKGGEVPCDSCHGSLRPAHAFVTSSICPACGNGYRTRLLAWENVERCSKVRRQAVWGGGMLPRPPCEVEAAYAVDRAWRQQARERGVANLAGPPAICTVQLGRSSLWRVSSRQLEPIVFWLPFVQSCRLIPLRWPSYCMEFVQIAHPV